MISSTIGGAFIVAASVVLVCESAALGQALTTAPPVGKFPGPCRYSAAVHAIIAVFQLPVTKLVGRGYFHVKRAHGFAPLKLHTGASCLDPSPTVPMCTPTPHLLLHQESASQSMIHASSPNPHSSAKLGLIPSMGTSVAQ